MCGVLPIVSRMLAAFMAVLLLLQAWTGADFGRTSKLRARRNSGNRSRPEEGDADRADAAGDDRGDRADQRGEEAALRLAQLVRGGDEQGRDRADPAAHVVGRVELDQRLADIDREHVGGAEHGQAERATAASSATGRRPIVAAPNRPTASEHLDADIVLQRPEREDRARSASRRPPARRANGRARSAPTWRMSRAIDRQHRGRAAEQHREQVERDRAEHAACSRGRSAARRPSGARDASSPRSACAASARSGTCRRATRRTGRRPPHKAGCGASA